MSTSHEMHELTERRQAIWPWIAMPLVVLLVAYTLQRFQDAAKTAAAQTPTHASSSDAGNTSDQ